MAQHAWCFPIEPALRLIVDCFEWGAKHAATLEHDLDQRLPHSRSRVDGRAGAGVYACRRFTYRGGIARGRRRRLRAASLVFWDIHNDFFEEIAKLRAARRMGATPEPLRRQASALVNHALSLADGGVTLTAQQP
jgi:methylmalonyl-CoA mutase N-terminal domain/subunit